MEEYKKGRFPSITVAQYSSKQGPPSTRTDSTTIGMKYWPLIILSFCDLMSSATDSNAIVSSRETITNGHDAARKTSLYSCTVSFAMKHHCPSGTRSDCAQLCQDMLKQIRITPTIRCQNDKTVVAKVAPSAMSFEPGTLDSDSLSGSTCDCQVVLFLEYKSSTAQCQTGSLVQDVKNSLKSKFKEDTEAQNADFVEKADTCNQ